LDEKQHQQAAGEVGTVDRRPGSGRRSAHTDETVELQTAKSGRQTSEPPNSQRNFMWSIDHQFRDYSQRSASEVLEENVHSTADWSAQREDNV